MLTKTAVLKQQKRCLESKTTVCMQETNKKGILMLFFVVDEIEMTYLLVRGQFPSKPSFRHSHLKNVFTLQITYTMALIVRRL